MKKIFVSIMTFVMFFGLSGCSSKYAVTFDSSPRGATLVCNGTNWGYTPKKLYYDEEVKEHTTLNVSNCSANWVSGARANYPSQLTIFPSGGTTFTLQRPNMDGYEKDAQFALQAEGLNYQKRQAEAAESANYNNQLNQMDYNNQQQANRNAQYLRNLGY